MFGKTKVKILVPIVGLIYCCFIDWLVHLFLSQRWMTSLLIVESVAITMCVPVTFTRLTLTSNVYK